MSCNPCFAPACKWRVPGECAYYSGEYITNYNITNGDNLNTVIQKITNYISNQSISETPNSATDTYSIGITLSNSYSRHIEANLKLDSAPTNKAVVGVEGLYVAPADFSADFNTTTGDLTMVVDNTEQVVNITSYIQQIIDDNVFNEGQIYTADNGLTMDVDNNTQLGGLLLHQTVIDHTGGDYQLEFVGDGGNGSSLLYAHGGVQGMTAQGSTVGLTGSSPVIPLWSSNTAASTNSIGVGLAINRSPSGAGAIGLGSSIQFNFKNDQSSVLQAGAIQLKWTSATEAAETAQYEIKLVNNGVAATTKFTLAGSGLITGNEYGNGTFTGTAAYWLAVNSDGDFIEVPAPDSAEPITADNGLTMSTAVNAQLGGTLLHTTTINATSSYYLAVTGNAIYTLYASTATNRAIFGEATGAGIGVTGTAASSGAGIGVQGICDNANGIGVYGNSIAGIGVNGISQTGWGGVFTAAPTSTNTLVGVAKLRRTASNNTPGDGIGGYLSYEIEHAASLSSEAARIGALWSSVSAKTSKLEFYTKNSDSMTKKVTIYGNGDVEIHSGGGLIMTDTGDATRRRITVVNGVLTVSAPL